MFIYNLIKPILFKLDAEFSHNISLKLLKILYKLGILSIFFKSRNSYKENKNTINILGINFNNKLGLAAGLDKNGDYIDALASLGFGFIEIGTITPKPQLGNSKPRLWRITKHQSIINRMGFNNKGIDYLISNVKNSKWVQNGGIIGINIGKNATTAIEDANQDYLICLEKAYNYASYITVNISSPNTAGLRSLQSGNAFSDLLECIKHKQIELQAIYSKYTPIFVKISPDLNKEDIKFIAQSLIKYKIDGVIATNTTIDKSALSQDEIQEGGLSGALVKDKSNSILEILVQELNGTIPIIGVGGILKPQDAIDKINLGASLIQVYSGLIYKGPNLVKNCIKALNKINEIK